MYTPVLHFDDINGRPLVGGKLYTYNANSSTPAPTYRNKSGTLLNENPISLDERGECEVWLVDGIRYKMVLVDPIGTQVWEADDVFSMTNLVNITVDGTSPVNVSQSVVEGVTRYTVSLKKYFVDEVHDNTRNIANETERAQGAEQNLSQSIDTVSSQLANETARAQEVEHTLSERIETVNTSLSNETYRAKTAEASARTVVRAGEGIQVSKVVDIEGDGHDEYFVSTYLPKATSTRFGVVKTGDDTVQVVPKNTPSQNKHRTYPVQKNADGQMVVNVPWRNDFKNVYKGVLILTIEGTCTDEYREATAVTSEHVTTQIVSPYYDDVSVYGYNTYSVAYHEEAGHPADHRPEFHVDNAGKLYFTFEDEHQEALAFHFALSIASKTGYDFIDDNEPVYAEWGHDNSMKQPVMDMVRTIVVKKSDGNTINAILGNGVNLSSAKTVDLTTSYKIEAVAEYLYTCSPPEFFVFDAVDDQGDNMVNEDGDNMVFYEENPEYIGD
jgi:hypothetical protein